MTDESPCPGIGFELVDRVLDGRDENRVSVVLSITTEDKFPTEADAMVKSPALFIEADPLLPSTPLMVVRTSVIVTNDDASAEMLYGVPSTVIIHPTFPVTPLVPFNAVRMTEKLGIVDVTNNVPWVIRTEEVLPVDVDWTIKYPD